MASIFTFDPDPPRVSSPWAAATPPPGRSPRLAALQDRNVPQVKGSESGNLLALGAAEMAASDYSTITRLEAEPQEGPTEYKLHLLLRRRRSFTHMSTRRHLSGSLRRSEHSAPVSVGRSVSESGLLSSTPPTQSRQHRLEQLTTQLLWRLQQSCTHHTSSSTAGVLPHFPDEAHLTAPIVPQRLYPGLEESKGALYEIGVADDGELLGLSQDEMEESLNNLRAMAASLGCRVDVQRMVPVGHCEWIDNDGTVQTQVKKSKLLVAEALVCPDQPLVEQQDPADPAQQASLSRSQPDKPHHAIQLRVSLTGATMSGKSSLLGTLSTGTLDNGRGKSRLSLLKHRHEIESGITSSITQELIGYHDQFNVEGTRTSTQVINYGSPDVSSWVDIHAAAGSSASERLLFLTDSAGHPRFRRTTVRGLVGWDPHYTLLCIPSDNAEDSAGKIGASPTTKEILGDGAADLDLSQEQLHLCLALDLPLLVVITKYDLATKAGLKGVLSKVLSALKEAGKTGQIITDSSTSNSEVQLDSIPLDYLQSMEGIAQSFRVTALSVVPIILTSAVKGTGLSKLHALLRELPIPSVPSPPVWGPKILFHIEDWYSKPAQKPKPDEPTIVGGHLRYGNVSIGDELVLGPYPANSSSDDSDSGSGRHSSRHSPVPTSRSFPGALQKRTTTPPSRSGSSLLFEWRRVRVTSLRNLRLPVRTLYCGQVGTIGIVPLGAPIASPAMNRIRKGMVLADRDAKAHKVISVRFEGANARAVDSLSIGSTVVVFVASVRATSRVISVHKVSENSTATVPDSEDTVEEGFGFGFNLDEDSAHENYVDEEHDRASSITMVATFQFMATREFVEEGAKVLVMPGGGPGLTGSTERGTKGVAGLSSFLGRVVVDERL
jgi:GTPase